MAKEIPQNRHVQSILFIQQIHNICFVIGIWNKSKFPNRRYYKFPENEQKSLRN